MFGASCVGGLRVTQLCHLQANSTANATFIVEVGNFESFLLEGSDVAVCQIFYELHGLTHLTAWMQDRPELPFTDLSWVDHGCRAYEVLCDCIFWEPDTY